MLGLRIYSILVTLTALFLGLHLFAGKTQNAAVRICARLESSGRSAAPPHLADRPVSTPPRAAAVSPDKGNLTSALHSTAASLQDASAGVVLPNESPADSLPSPTENARLQTATIEKYVQITGEQRRRLLDSFTAADRLMQLTLPPAEYDRRNAEIETIDDILGEEQAAKYYDAMAAESDNLNFLQVEKEVAYLSNALSLSKEQEAQLQSALLEPDRVQLEETALLERLLRLTSSQKNAALNAFKELYRVEALPDPKQYLEARGRVFRPGEEIDFAEFSEQYFRDRLRPVLSNEQYNKLLDYQASQPRF